MYTETAVKVATQSFELLSDFVQKLNLNKKAFNMLNQTIHKSINVMNVCVYVSIWGDILHNGTQYTK